MVFGLFSRKSTLDDTTVVAGSPDIRANGSPRFPTPTPSIASVTHPSPLRFQTVLRNVLGNSATDLTLKDSDIGTGDSVTEERGNTHSPAPPPPDTPTPPPVIPSETKALYDLMLKIPPKTLHAYTLTHLQPQRPLPSTSASPLALGLQPENAPCPPSPNTASKLTAFFSTLAPPPLLHCVRCHKDFHDVENEEKDKACRVPHDDESTLVTRLPSGGGYETLWGCCGQTASGDGSEGPPDGWCYEGRHTTDIKRARFRADSTIHDDKLTSCLKLNCHGIRDQLPRRDVHASPAGTTTMRSSVRRSNPSPARSQVSVLASRSSRKRPRKSLKEASGSENEGDAESVVDLVGKGKDEEKAGGNAEQDGDAKDKDKDKNIPTDELNLNPSSNPEPKPKRRGRPPRSSTTIASVPAGSTKPVSPQKSTTPAKPKPISRTLLSQSHTHLASDSEVSTRSGPRTRSLVREESGVSPTDKDGSRRRAISKPARAGASERVKRALQTTTASEEEAALETDEQQDSERERGRGRKKRRLGRD